MIVVVEGPSAAGKTAWSTDHGAGNVVAETGGVDLPVDLSDEALGEFWTEMNCHRWAMAVTAEAERGVAICDTDPLKLHDDYCLAMVGAESWRRFDVDVSLTIQAISSCRLGIADVLLVSIPSDEVLDRQRASDALDAGDASQKPRSEICRNSGSVIEAWCSAVPARAIGSGRYVLVRRSASVRC